MRADALLARYDAALREDAEVTRADSVVRRGPLLWACFADHGFVTYRTLDAVRGAALDDLIVATVAHFRDETGVAGVEWKTRGHDRVPGLSAGLAAHGFVAGEVETVMVGQARALSTRVDVPVGIAIRRAGRGADLLDDVERVEQMQGEVFGARAGRDAGRVAAQLARHPEQYQMWLAEQDGQVVGAGTLDVVPGTGFAGLWGGSVRPGWRGRGIYRGLVSARARAAVALGVEHLHSDCTVMSRPILERSGLVAVTTTTPYEWQRVD